MIISAFAGPPERAPDSTHDTSLSTFVDDARRAETHAAHARARNTLRAYRSDLADFDAYCSRANVPSCPAQPSVVAAYVAHLAASGRKFSTIRRRMTAIYGAHKARGFAMPVDDRLRRTMQGLARDIGTARARKTALTADHLRAALAEIDGSIHGVRDRALLLLGFAGAFRRSELAALDVADVDFRKSGLVVTLRRSKTDQEGAGDEVGIPSVTAADVDAVRALRTWLAVANISDGPLFRAVRGGQVLDHRIEGRTVAALVKRVTASAGIVGDFSGHSLRSGFVTSADEAGVSASRIMRTTRHKSHQTLQGYIRPANVLKDTALEAILG